MTVQDLLNELIRQPGDRQIMVSATCYSPAWGEASPKFVGSVTLLPSHVSYVNGVHVVIACEAPRVIEMGLRPKGDQ
jgi:hypothetical protein